MMFKKIAAACLAVLVLVFIVFFAPDGSKSSNIIVVYAVTAVLSFILALGCWLLLPGNEKWFRVLCASVCAVNAGYLALALSPNLGFALMANRLAYLGSVFLPLSMLMIIMKSCRTECGKKIPVCLIGLSVLVFLIAASPGVLDIYYKDASLKIVDGVSSLDKVYGPLHSLYMIYLLGYFTAMTVVIFDSYTKKKSTSILHAVGLLMVVFVNIGVWLLEQFVYFGIEMLAVSYIISEIFLISLYIIHREHENAMSSVSQQNEADAARNAAGASDDANGGIPEDADNAFAEKCAYFREQLLHLTPTENTVFFLYLDGKNPKDIMQELDIKETTLKYHNRNIYGKLGVSSRRQMLEIAAALNIKSTQD